MSDEIQPRDNGRFVKGHVYNPGGRPKGSRTFASVLQGHLEALDAETGMTELDNIILNLIACAKRRSRLGVVATKLIAAYTDGLPATQDEFVGPVGGAGVVLVLPSNGRELPLVDEENILQAEVVNGRVSVAFPAFDEDEG